MKDKFQEFCDICHVYLKEKEKIKTLQENDPLYAIYEDDIAYVGSCFQKIEKEFDKEICSIVYDLLVKGLTQTKVADHYHLSRRQVQYMVKKVQNKAEELW